MKQECLAPGAVLSEAERRHVLHARSIYEYDDTFVGPRNGYANADEYYAENMALRFLAQVRHPTLVIHARDDPWIPADAYTTYGWDRNPALIPLLPGGGGHVGFHGRGDGAAWHDRCIDLFFERLLVDGHSRPW
jgi:predicted alpha/beta-fold hydrolase